MTPETTSVSIVVPVYNSQASLPLLAQRLEPALRQCNVPFELVLVNDGSADESWEVIQSLAQRHSWIRGLNLLRNFGQHNALLSGIRSAKYDVVITMDDDLQHPPEEIGRLLAEIAKGHDVVYGYAQKLQHGLFRNLASLTTKQVLRRTMGVSAATNISAFRAFRTKLRDAFAQYSGPYVSIDVLLSWGTTRFSGVQVDHQPRAIGQSNYTLRKLTTYAMNMITGFTTIPLKVASIVGFSFMMLGLFLLGYVVLRYLTDSGNVPGFSFLASVIVIFAGVQLFALGIIGEYLGRVHLRLMDRPTYVIRETVAAETDPT